MTSLRFRARSCEFAELTDSLIHDKVVLSCPDARFQERLLRESDLSLTKAIDLSRAAKATQQQLRAIKAGTDITSAIQTVSFITASAQVHKHCGNCGGQHAHKPCPAYGKACRNCGKLKHFASCCRSLKKNGVSDVKLHYKGKKPFNSHKRSPSSSDNKTGAANIHTVDFENQSDLLYVGQLSVDVVHNGMAGHNSNRWWKYYSSKVLTSIVSSIVGRKLTLFLA